MTLAAALACLVLAAGAAAGGAATPTGWIVFVSNLSPAALQLDGHIDQAQLHSFSADGGARLDLTPDPDSFSDERASLSPDGRRIAFFRRDRATGISELWISDVDGSNSQRLLAPDPEEGFDFSDPYMVSFASPAWSPDGTRLAIDVVSTASCLPGYTKCASWYTVIVDLAGRRVGSAGGLNAVWSPDGRSLLLLSGLFSLEGADAWEMVVERVVGSLAGRWGERDKRPGACWSGGSWSPDGARLLLVESDCEGAERRLHVIRTRDWDERAVLKGSEAAWAPDGSRIAYVDQSAKTPVLTAVTRDGTRAKRIARGAFGAVWSPSGRRLAYIQPMQPRSGLMTARPDGTAVRRIAEGKWQAAWVDAWSRDGRRIAFTTTRANTSTITVVSSSGGPVRTIRREAQGGFDAVSGWTFDDRRLVVERWVSGLYGDELWLARPDGSSPRRLATGESLALGPAWSPDGSTIAFWRDTPATRERPETLTVHTIPVAGGVARRVVGGPSGSYASDPDWSPDGKRLVFVRWPDSFHQDLFVVDADGRNLRRVTDTGNAFAPAWSPDGQTIAFINDGRIKAVAPSGGEIRALTDPQGCTGVAWSPDGIRLAAACSAGLVVLDADGTDWRVLDPTGSSSAPSWSPDGAWITYNPGQRLRVVSAAGGTPTGVDLRGADVRDPDWSS